MGKSTTAEMFAEHGVPVWDADAAVHRLYAVGGAAVDKIGKIAPKAIVQGAVDREVLKEWISKDKTALKQLEQIVHPMVAADRAQFIKKASAPIILLDIPLLFETKGEGNVDAIVVVSTDEETQEARVLERPGMTNEHFLRILAKQIPDAEKRLKADYVIDTTTLDSAKEGVAACLKSIKERLENA